MTEFTLAPEERAELRRLAESRSVLHWPKLVALLDDFDALVTERETALKQERGEIAYLLHARAADHQAAAEESYRNDERADAFAHEHEATVWRDAAAMVSARGKPPAQKSAEIAEDEIAF